MNDAIGPETDIDNFYNFVFNLNTAHGFGLDDWGIIVGITRYLEIVPSGVYVGYYNPAFTQPDQVYTPFSVAPFFNGNAATNTVPVPDDIFRKMIFAKAYANIHPPSIPTINKVLEIILGAGVGYVKNNHDMTIEFIFNVPISAIDGDIIYNSGIVPIPDGVEVIV